MSKILIVDDDESVFNVFKAALNPSIELFYSDSIEEARKHLKNTSPDLIIFDLYLEKEKSLNFILELKLEAPNSFQKVLLMTGKGDISDEIESHQLGIRDYIKKPLDLKLTKAIIEKHLIGLTSKTQTNQRVGPFIININEHKISLCQEDGLTKEIDLTLKQYLILKYFLNSVGRVLTREQIMIKVWDYESETLTRTVDMHVSTIRKKITPYSSMIQTKRGLGYIFNL